MYRRRIEGWLKYYDFILLDMLCLQIAYILAYIIRQGEYGLNPYEASLYRNMALYIAVVSLGVLLVYDSLENVLKRGYYKEFMSVFQQVATVSAFGAMGLFLVKEAEAYSRLTFTYAMIIYFVLTYVVRILWKQHLKKRPFRVDTRRLLIVTTKSAAKSVLNNVMDDEYVRYQIAGVAVIDKSMIGKKIANVEVVADAENVVAYACHEGVDEVLWIPAKETEESERLMEQLIAAGVIVHMNLAKMSNLSGKRQIVETIGDYTVLTTSFNYTSTKLLVAKRTMDIVFGLIGCIMTGIIFLFIAPIIYISSPGPIFFAQERVGKNGKKFKMYKFRSMYPDAEERKATLMKDNKLGDGKMFKLDFDPRVIGNKILANGKKKTGIGDFIRKTSLDEFPQFFNVLKGDMSLVGTRPPLVDEVEQYELHHYARLSVKPGITGLWQISGRSDIVDFEEVVRLDKQYISEWNMGMDLKILFKTVLVVLGKKGSV